MSILIGDCRQTLAALPERSVHMVVTSPPYWGLRDYGNDAQIGLERTPDAYIANLLDVFRAVRRVLRDDAVCWLNLGDSYAGGGSCGSEADLRGKQGSNRGSRSMVGKASVPDGMSAGQLIGIPWRVALALQSDGWLLRSDVIWAKRAPMPESVMGWRWERCRVKARGADHQAWSAESTPGRAHSDGRHAGGEPARWRSCPGCSKCDRHDGYVLRRGSWRPTRSHEYVFMLAKSERYFADGEGVRDPLIKGNARSDYHRGKTGKNGLGRVSELARIDNPSGRNLRDVWTLGPAPSSLKHFAMMPPALVEKCMRSGPNKVCGECGAPWVRMIEREFEGRRADAPYALARGVDHQGGGIDRAIGGGQCPTVRTCGHEAEVVPPIVLDPFLGAGTVAGVAEHLGWSWYGCELSTDYAALVPARIAEVRAWFARRAGRVVKPRYVAPQQTELTL